MRPWTVFLLVIICFGESATSFSQDKKPGEKEEVIRVDTQLVDVPIAVTTPAGQAVRGLKA